MARVYQRSWPFSGDAFDLFWLFKDEPQAFFLDSSLQGAQGRFSYIGFAPFKTIRGDLAELKREFNKHRIQSGKLCFPAGAVGYFGYDGSLCFGFYDTIIAVDHKAKKVIVSSFSKARVKELYVRLSSGGPGLRLRCSSWRNTTLSAARMGFPWLDDLGACRALLNRNPGPPEETQDIHFKSNFTKAGYMKAVRQALEHIRRGDIYQINLSHQIKTRLPKLAHPVALYANLRAAFPSEFGAYFDDGKQVILSASPERFLKLHNGIIQVKPMKGTRPRGKTKMQDKKLKEELLRSPKEIAELLMVTDLERNDLGRVCDYASVKVKAMRTIEAYSSVFQATSTIEGRLRRDCDQFDLLRATFPSGSVTGCPKIEAMKIIKKLERGSRGLYTGALGYMSFSGDMDFNVMIRTLFLKEKRVSFHAGGGIVADSKPLAEWEETWVKAKPLIEALKKDSSPPA